MQVGTEIEELARLSNTTLEEKTGKGWLDWIAFLENLKVGANDHKEIVSALTSQVDSSWYRNKIASGYREYKGQRKTGKLENGYEIGVSKTFAENLDRVWDEIISGRGIKVWLGDIGKMQIHGGQHFENTDDISGSVTTYKDHSHLRLSWKRKHWKSHSILQIRITSTGKHHDKTTITFHHEKLPTATDRRTMKAHWQEKLSALGKMFKGK
ncbi:SRPBCC domain-containing protein [Dyadobacter luticola]|uniref:Activator of Hsp90 ATPase homologue 1/2-like C-terminal domain-containing protein n=1 Tax=Dyadobacter luticola TaxID=1979387 RepID=A0A5R9L3S0_9BACT|nr:SRPBCC domain-containing protein [Dyadobacter luticola]TLV02999.1 hypothetical protein FEN17_05135 [Dyadobacter luticola]